jgi:hypothetical protein
MGENKLSCIESINSSQNKHIADYKKRKNSTH